MVGSVSGAAPSVMVTGALACCPRLRMPAAATATEAHSTAATTSNLLGRARCPRPVPSSAAVRPGSEAVGRLSGTMASLLASSRTSNRPARAASARSDSFPARGPCSVAGSWQRSAMATRSLRRFSAVASEACRNPHSTGRSPSPWSTWDGSIRQWAIPMSWRSPTTSATAATAAARPVGSLIGRVDHVSELTNSVCRARPWSGVSTRSTNRTTPGWSTRLRVSASRSRSRACAAGTCLTAIRRSPERLTVTVATVGPPSLDPRCHTAPIELTT